MTDVETPARLLRVVLPWPGAALSPNSRGHWRKSAAAKKHYRRTCAILARQQGTVAGCMPAGRLRVCMTFVQPDKRRRDLDNLIAAMKSGLDGLADAMGVDDARFALSAELIDATSRTGFVRVEVGPC
jgi:crossover junction endodeoxyribonuclease RusA